MAFQSNQFTRGFLAMNEQISAVKRQDSKLLELARKIASKAPVDPYELQDCGISGSLRLSLVESLLWAAHSSDNEIRALCEVVFSQAEDIYGYLDGLVRESTPALEKFVSSGIMGKLAKGEASPPRLGLVATLESRQAVVFTISSVLFNNCEVIRSAPATWRSATQAVTSGEDRAEMITLFLEELGVSSSSRLCLHTYVWTQGNAEAVEAVHSIANTDDFEIADAALSINGVSDYPCYELIGVSDLLTETIKHPQTDVRLVMLNFVSLIARAFEIAAEHAEAAGSESASVPQVVSLDLGRSFSGTIRALNWVVDPKFVDVRVSANRDLLATGSITELSLEVTLKPCWFSIRVMEGVTAEIILIKSIEGTEGAWPMWKVIDLRGSDGRIAKKEQKEDGFIFSLVGVPGNPTVVEEVILNSGESDEVRLDVSWVPRIEKPHIPVPAPMLPTEINLPPTISSSMMRTIPLIPRPRLVLLLQEIEEVPRLSHASFSRDLVTNFSLQNLSIRDLVREIGAHDIVAITEEVLEGRNQFVAGVAVGAAKTLQILARSSSSDVGGCELMKSLVEQGYATLVYPS
jgi:hypothetical protein